jgi:hypothetical protein
MAVHEKQPAEVENCRCLLQGAVKNLADRLYGPSGPAWRTSFSHLEKVAVLLGGSLQKHLLTTLLARQAATFHTAPPADACQCPSCGGDTLARAPEPRILHSCAGDAEWSEPQRYCGKCRKAFFPQSQSLGIDLGHYSSSVLDLVCYAGANKPSFREASLDLNKLADLDVSEKQVERLSKRIGGERLAERDEQVAAFEAMTLVERKEGIPDGVAPPDKDHVAVVMADAGMLQLRRLAERPDEAAEKGSLHHSEDVLRQGATLPAAVDASSASPSVPISEQLCVTTNAESHSEVDAAATLEDDDEGDEDDEEHSGHWREDKVGLVLTMKSKVSSSDPCPEIPKTFLDPDRVSKIVRGLKKSAALVAEEKEEPTEIEERQDAIEEAKEYEGPKLKDRRVVASRKSWPLFGTILASAAWLAGFAKAERRAFVADGARSIWKVWRTRFSSYVPILDFIHAMSYVYAAGKAVGEDAVRGWTLYTTWIEWVWQGKVRKVIKALQEWQKQHGEPAKGEAETTPRSVVAKTLRYLLNNQSKMKYAEYRKKGLPLVSSLVESMVKQISRRVKGTEKFWGDEGAEAILQLRADYLSDGEVMDRFWERRQAAATGQRSYRPRADLMLA